MVRGFGKVFCANEAYYYNYASQYTKLRHDSLVKYIWGYKSSEI